MSQHSLLQTALHYTHRFMCVQLGQNVESCPYNSFRQRRFASVRLQRGPKDTE